MLNIVCNWLMLMSVFGASRPDTAALDAYLERTFAQAAYPGLSVVMVQRDHILYARGFGVATVGKTRPMTADTPTAIGSITKSMTALAVMRLVDQGRLDLDAPVTTYLPDFRTADKQGSDRITVRMLLANSSGLPSMDRGITDRNQADDAEGALIAALAGQVLHRDPGSGFEYTNEGFVVAGAVAARIHGKPFAQTLADLVLKPLAMKHSSTIPAEVTAMGGLTGHYAGAEAGLPAMQGLASVQFAAAGSIQQCSARDFGRYLCALLTGHDGAGQPFISASAVAEMWRGQIGMPENERLGAMAYGLGWMIGEVDGRRVVSHGGHAMTMTSFAMLVPEQEIAIAVFANIETLNLQRFADLTTIANNGLHAAMGEPLSDWGKPKRPDPTRNDFEFDEAQRRRFVGRYAARGLGTMQVDVTADEQGVLHAEVVADGQTVKAGRLDFMNSARCVIRGIGSPTTMFWALSRSGEVLSARYNGTRLRRVGESAPENRPEPTHAGRLSLTLAANWSVTTDENAITAQRETNKLWTGVVDGAPGPRELAALLEPRAAADVTLTQGVTSGVTVGPYYWRKTTLHLAGDAGATQIMVLQRAVGEETLAWVLATEAGTLTHCYQAEGRAMLTSLVLAAR
ncbi:serine hydrolase domain-containing protein [Acanthopleuribacter pedis]|uniref:Beta-lactamase family protein n=1 Tax=Acanthopleuribacter pedis TaxID=442870 RepID=A0A8J7Q9K3_9BACT|nr:serine hydrolase domain-containing protein [Acanthopleuribacter pedis]MBO1319474.1 beta-lactamase family protein [Acanthopleuribacter pedis]